MIVIETASSVAGMKASDWITLAAALLAFTASIVAVIFSRRSSHKSDNVAEAIGILNASTQDKQRLIETISVQRIVWINSLRDEFVEFNKNLVMYSDITGKNLNQITPEETQRYELVIASMYRITLLLNPSEHYMQYVIGEINTLVQVNSTLRGDYDIQPYIKSRKIVEDLQQIILKAEWLRVKEESKIGAELTEDRVVEIYNEIAKDINVELYDYIQDWIQLEIDLQNEERED